MEDRQSTRRKALTSKILFQQNGFWGRPRIAYEPKMESFAQKAETQNVVDKRLTSRRALLIDHDTMTG